MPDTDRPPPRPPARRLAAEAVAIAYLGAVAATADVTGISYLLFPELAALAHDVLTRPRGTWARAPALVAATPVLTAILGTFIARHMAYGLPAILLTVAGAILVIRLLRSPVAPAISAGLLPLSLGVTSWLYPPSILAGTGILAGLSLLGRRFAPAPPEPLSAADLRDDIVELPPTGLSWLPAFLIFLIADASLAVATGWRFLLYPPLVVIAFEMFAHPAACPWAPRPLALAAACTLSAGLGTLFVLLLGATPAAVMLSMTGGVLLLRLFRLHVPPALAVGLLPFVLPQVDGRFPLAVGGGTLLLAGLFLLWRRARTESTPRA